MFPSHIPLTSGTITTEINNGGISDYECFSQGKQSDSLSSSSHARVQLCTIMQNCH